MARRRGQRNYPPEIRQAVLAGLLAGQGVEEVAKQFNISHPPLARFVAE
jgi:transposase-like protein